MGPPSKSIDTPPSPALSVIIPSFNCSHFLADVLASFLAIRDRDDIEIIVVDDGSDDNPDLVVTRFKEKGLNLRLLSLEENQGLSSARNHGLAVSRGKFVLFVDCDDAVEAGWLAWILPEMERLSLDVLVVGERRLGSVNAEVASNDYPREDLGEEVYSGYEHLFLSLMKSAWKPSACLQIVRRQMLVDGGIVFEKGLVYEDILYSLALQRHAERLAQLPIAFYLRRLTYPSLSRGPKQPSHFLSLVQIYERLSHRSSSAKSSRHPLDVFKDRIIRQEIQRIIAQKAVVDYQSLDPAIRRKTLHQSETREVAWPRTLSRLSEVSWSLTRWALTARRISSLLSRKTLWRVALLLDRLRNRPTEKTARPDIASS